MKPLNLQGHSRPIKKILFSDNGEMLFTASADRNVISWFTNNGEKYKTYAHSAAVNTLVLSNEGSYLISGDNTGCTYIWDVKGGTLLKKIEHDPSLSVRSLDMIDISFLMVIYAGRTKLAQSFINIYKFDELMPKTTVTNNVSYTGGGGRYNLNFYEGGSIYSMSNISNSRAPMQTNNNKGNTITHEQIVPFKHFECMTNTNTKYVKAKFIYFNNNPNVKLVLNSREDGYMELINMTSGKLIFENKFHDDIIFDFDFYPNKNIVLTSSKDGTACVFNIDTLDVLHRFKPENPVRFLNACQVCYVQTEVEEKIEIKESSNNINNEINKILDTCSTPQESSSIKLDVDSLFGMSSLTINPSPQISSKKIVEKILFVVSGGMDSKIVTTSKQEGGFEIIGYDMDTNSTDFSILTHFGPVNTISYSQSKRLLASGSEDSSIKVYLLDDKINSYK
jgi:WD40 repeat protein